ncbi:MAG: hypothetical protein M1379_10555 [Firmicutes bacterium]|nr:hypothetical protein [Bacillota bacterium]
MSIKPVDFPVIVQRATDVDKVQQIREHSGQTAQQQFAAQVQAEMVKQHSQVQNMQKTEHGKVTKEKEKRQRKEEEKPGKQPDKQPDKAVRGDGAPGSAADQKGGAGKDEGPGSHLDIRL